MQNVGEQHIRRKPIKKLMNKIEAFNIFYLANLELEHVEIQLTVDMFRWLPQNAQNTPRVQQRIQAVSIQTIFKPMRELHNLRFVLQFNRIQKSPGRRPNSIPLFTAERLHQLQGTVTKRRYGKRRGGGSHEWRRGNAGAGDTAGRRGTDGGGKWVRGAGQDARG